MCVCVCVCAGIPGFNLGRWRAAGKEKEGRAKNSSPRKIICIMWNELNLISNRKSPGLPIGRNSEFKEC